MNICSNTTGRIGFGQQRGSTQARVVAAKPRIGIRGRLRGRQRLAALFAGTWLLAACAEGDDGAVLPGAFPTTTSNAALDMAAAVQVQEAPDGNAATAATAATAGQQTASATAANPAGDVGDATTAAGQQTASATAADPAAGDVGAAATAAAGGPAPAPATGENPEMPAGEDPTATANVAGGSCEDANECPDACDPSEERCCSEGGTCGCNSSGGSRRCY